eukprot:6187780-Pleurochrysis_carterae.AAC.2
MGWAACVEEDAAACAAMLAKVPARYRLAGTGFTKATVSVNKPTRAHTDFANTDLTFLIAYDVSRGSGRLMGSSHVLVDTNFQAAVVLSDSADVMFVIGPYQSILHANLATTSGSCKRDEWDGEGSGAGGTTALWGEHTSGQLRCRKTFENRDAIDS